MALTKRDKVAWEFLNTFRMARIDQVARVAYEGKYQICCNRLRKLAVDKVFNTRKDTMGQGLLYSVNPIKSLKQYFHYMMRNECYIAFKEQTVINEVLVEPTFGSIQPDMVLIGKHKGKRYFYLVEVETTIKQGEDYDKYNHFFIKEWREYFNKKPVVLYVTDKRIKDDKINFTYQVVAGDMSNLADILEDNPF